MARLANSTKALEKGIVDPEKYTEKPEEVKIKGLFRRFLERLAKVNKEQFGGKPKCCQ